MKKENQIIELATALGKNRVATPCISVVKGEITRACPLLDLRNGCIKGYVQDQNKTVVCSEGKGPIVFHSENIPLEENIPLVIS